MTLCVAATISFTVLILLPPFTPKKRENSRDEFEISSQPKGKGKREIYFGLYVSAS